jgi:hypothetical protein
MENACIMYAADVSYRGGTRYNTMKLSRSNYLITCAI